MSKKKADYPSSPGNKSPARVAEPAVPSYDAALVATDKPKAPAKRATNLTLDPEAIARGDQYSARMGISLSKLVSDFLSALPEAGAEETQQSLTPLVRRLHGIACTAGDVDEKEEYRRHLRRKYGER